MKGLVLLLVLVIGVGISFAQTEEESDELIVTITDANGNLVEVPSAPHVGPIVTDESPPPPNSNILAAPTGLTINNVQYSK